MGPSRPHRDPIHRQPLSQRAPPAASPTSFPKSQGDPLLGFSEVSHKYPVAFLPRQWTQGPGPVVSEHPTFKYLHVSIIIRY